MSNEELFNMRKIIKLTLIKVGIRCDLGGFRYLCCAVEKVVQQPELIYNLCKGLYAEVAKEFNVNKVTSVERSIRHAIDNTQDAKSFAELNKLFDTLLYTIDDKPTVGELIMLIAQYYCLGLYESKNI